MLARRPAVRVGTTRRCARFGGARWARVRREDADVGSGGWQETATLTTPPEWVCLSQCHNARTGADPADPADATDRERFTGRDLGRPLVARSTTHRPLTGGKLQSTSHRTGEGKSNRCRRPYETY